MSVEFVATLNRVFPLTHVSECSDLKRKRKYTRHVGQHRIVLLEVFHNDFHSLLADSIWSIARVRCYATFIDGWHEIETREKNKFKVGQFDSKTKYLNDTLYNSSHPLYLPKRAIAAIFIAFCKQPIER